jgi:putative ABC transport system permease protein
MSGRQPGSGRASYWQRLSRILRKDPLEETDAEIGFHFEMRVRDYMQQGMGEEEARSAAHARLGDMEQVRLEVGHLAAAESRVEQRREWWFDLQQDFRFGARMLWRAPTFSGMSVLTLALGIGATTAIFSLVWAILLAPLPYAQPDQLVRVWETTPRGNERNVVSAGNVVDWQTRARSFSILGAHTGTSPVTLTGEGDAALVAVSDIQAQALAALGANPVLGRTFVPDDATTGDVVLVSHAFWQDRYGSDPGILDRRLVLNDVPYTVVGVMPAGFTFPGDAIDLWRPLTSARVDPTSRTSHNYQVVARLAEGATLETAQLEMSGIAAQIAEEYPADMMGWSARVVPLHEDLTREVASLFWVLLGGVGVVLLITCANIANLLLARAVDRHREMALRGALGAARGRLVRQLLTESMMLTALGGGAAILLAPALLGVLVGAAPVDIPLLDRAAIDGRMFVFTAVAALLCALLFGLAPALRLARVNLESTLRSGRDASQTGHIRVRGLLLVGQVALSVILLVGAGLFVRSFRVLQTIDLGFEPEGLVVMEVDLPQARFRNTPQQVDFYDRLLDRAGSLPGVARVAGTSQPPGSTQSMTFSFAIEGRVAANPSGREDDEILQAVTPGYFEVLGLEMATGRPFDQRDGPDGAPVVILNQSLADKHFPDGDAVGNRISFRDGDAAWMEIIGVAEDARIRSPDTTTRPVIFIPYAQKTWPWLTWMAVVARGEPGMDPVALSRPLSGALRDVDPNIPPDGVQTVAEAFRERTARRAFAMTLVAGFGLLALILSVVGLYGLISYSVAREQREIGVRIALGAHRGDVVGRVLRRSLGLTAVGALVGLVGAAAVSRLVESLLYGVSAVDGVTYASSAALMLAAALVTTAVPALRAAHTDPVEAIRSE